MNAQTKDYSYFQQGMERVGTASSFLVSSSKYLNNLQIREWTATQMLRRNGPDAPVPADVTLGLAQGLDEIRDEEAIAVITEREKRINPKFKAWVEERHLPQLTVDDFAQYPEGSFGNVCYDLMKNRGFQLSFGQQYKEPESDFEFIRTRWWQTHDFEHILTGGGFNSYGELMTFYVRHANLGQHWTGEMARIINEIQIFSAARMVMRTMLHYPTLNLKMLDVVRRAITVGFSSECIAMMRFEDVLHLPIPQAREALGLRNVIDVDNYDDDEVFTERRQPTEKELLRIGIPELRAVGL